MGTLLPPQFFYKFKTLLKLKVYLKNNNGSNQLFI